MSGFLKNLWAGAFGEGASDAAGPEGAPPLPLADDATRAAALEALGQVIDPELGVDLVNLGLVRRIEREGDALRVTITATSPACPMGPYLLDESRSALEARLPHLGPVEVLMEWDPPWRPEDMSPSARAELGLGDR